MTLVEILDTLTKWTAEKVCSQITFKLPDDAKNDDGYTLTYVHPAAFPLFVPGKDRLPPNVPAPFPSVCVQMMEGKDTARDRRRNLQIRLCLAVWNPGEHGLEKFYPVEDPAAPMGWIYVHQEELIEEFKRNMGGWRDVFNFLDLIVRQLEITEYIGGIRIIKEDGITYGPFAEQNELWDAYPYWLMWVRFSVEATRTMKVPDSYANLL